MKKYIILLTFCFFASNACAGFESNPQWLAIAHYKKGVFGNYKSSIDSENFFLAKDGKNSPKAELDATIELFSSNDNEKKCLFPARYKILFRNGIIKTTFPKCKDLEQFYTDLQPAGVTLLFTDAYMNNPSSLFGHTLLRIDTKRKGTQLLGHGVNYGAFVGENPNGALYVLFGLTGGYYGGFTVKPYYDITNMYNNIENRDIWEYRLDYSDQELDLFVAHLWEAGHTQTRYYFFTKNCSYMLMEMLDAVRPDLKVSDDFPLQTIPVDTIKSVNARKGFVKEVDYRPSRQAKIINKHKQMNPAQKEVYAKLIKTEDYTITNLTEEEKAGVLETAYQYVQYQFVAKDLELADYRQKSFKALKARNDIKADDKLPELTMGENPVLSHSSMRTTLGFGFRNGNSFQEISYRPAYNSLTDNGYGLKNGAEINFLNTTFRHYDDDNNYVLQKLDLIGIRSLAPISQMFKPISFQVTTDIARTENPQTLEEGYVFNLMVGGGTTFEVAENIYTYAMINNYVSYGGFLPNNQWVGLGFAGGIFVSIDDFKILAQAEKMLNSSKFAPIMKYEAEISYATTTNIAIAIKYEYQQNYGHDFDEFVVYGKYFF